MVDIHTHILPAVDDGVQSYGEALELARTEATGGTTCIVATPHVYTEEDLKSTVMFAERTRQLAEAFAKDEAGILLVQGAEVFPMSAIAKALDEGLPITTGNHRRHMLLDLPMSNLPMDFDNILFDIQSRKVTPILAHPERNGSFQSDPERLFEYRERGIALQVNAGSLSGRYGERAAHVARFILRRHWAHFLASDAHRPRPQPILRRAVDKLRESIDPAYLEILTETSGRCIVEGRDLPRLPPAPPERKRSFLDRLLRRD